MAAAYTVRIAALALDVSTKWIDNLLSHHSIPGVSGGRQGLERAISMDGLLAIEIARLAIDDLGLTVARAAWLASRLVEDRPASGIISTASGISVAFPLERIERRVRERLIEAVEAAPRPRRGRPPRG